MRPACLSVMTPPSSFRLRLSRRARDRRNGVEEGQADRLHQRAETPVRAQNVEGPRGEREKQALAAEHGLLQHLDRAIVLAQAEMDERGVVVPNVLGGGPAIELGQQAARVVVTTPDPVEMAENADGGSSGGEQALLHRLGDL